MIYSFYGILKRNKLYKTTWMYLNILLSWRSHSQKNTYSLVPLIEILEFKIDLDGKKIETALAYGWG